METDFKMIIEVLIVIGGLYARYEILKSHNSIKKEVAQDIKEQSSTITASLQRMEDIQRDTNDKIQTRIKDVEDDYLKKEEFQTFKEEAFIDIKKRLEKLEGQRAS